MGEANARRVFMSGRRFDVAEAVQLGPLARAKALLRALGPRIDEATIQHTIAELAACWEGDEAPERIGVFFGKRNPYWQS